ncbi:MAG: hypothetical protein ABIV48_09295, partial [Pyrinomonadaceae bacterium]
MLLVLAVLPNTARADVSLLILEAVGVAGEYTGSGHSAIYLSRLCAESPVRLRMCRLGENGVVLSSYPSFVGGKNYEWMAVPLIPYLYGVENDRAIPLYANGEIRAFLRETYRRNHLSSVVRGNENGVTPKGDWRIMLTAALNRDIYSLNVQTSVSEDERILREFNLRPNDGDFNSFTRNCADFARKLVNRYFPGAASRDLLNDFGVTTPKAVARSFTKYAKARPERLFHLHKYAQVSGSIWRSFDNRNFSEMAFKSKKYVIPSIVFYPTLVPIFMASYYLTGRFDLDKTYREYPNSRIAQLKIDRELVKKHNRADSPVALSAKELDKKIAAAKFDLLGDDVVWNGYKTNFDPVITSVIAQGLFQDENEIKTFFRDLELQSEPIFDEDGFLGLKVNYYDQVREVGLTRQNIQSANSDKELALKLMLAKIHAQL